MEIRVPTAPVANCPAIHEFALDEYHAREALRRAQERGFAALDRQEELQAEAGACWSHIVLNPQNPLIPFFAVRASMLQAAATGNRTLSQLDIGVIDALEPIIDSTSRRMIRHMAQHARYGTCPDSSETIRSHRRSRSLGSLAFWRRKRPTAESGE